MKLTEFWAAVENPAPASAVSEAIARAERVRFGTVELLGHEAAEVLDFYGGSSPARLEPRAANPRISELVHPEGMRITMGEQLGARLEPGALTVVFRDPIMSSIGSFAIFELGA